MPEMSAFDCLKHAENCERLANAARWVESRRALLDLAALARRLRPRYGGRWVIRQGRPVPQYCPTLNYNIMALTARCGESGLLCSR